MLSGFFYLGGKTDQSEKLGRIESYRQIPPNPPKRGTLLLRSLKLQIKLMFEDKVPRVGGLGGITLN